MNYMNIEKKYREQLKQYPTAQQERKLAYYLNYELEQLSKYSENAETKDQSIKLLNYFRHQYKF